MTTEVILALLANLAVAAGWICALMAILMVIALIAELFCLDALKDLEVDNARKERIESCRNSYGRMQSYRKNASKLALASLMIACTPNVEQLFRIRVELIKFELASPENVKQGTEAITRIASKLECKYLGCPEKEAKEKK